jgi:hypothetical protein
VRIAALLLGLLLVACGAEREEAARRTSPQATPSPSLPVVAGVTVPPSSRAPGPSVEDFPAEPPFGPEGWGSVVLGLPLAELAALPGVRTEPVTGRCTAFRAGAVDGIVDEHQGVVALTLRADAETPERVPPSATLGELRRVYPDGVHDGPLYLAPVPGHDDRHYRFDRPGALMLVLDDQRCAG